MEEKKYQEIKCSPSQSPELGFNSYPPITQLSEHESDSISPAWWILED